MPSSSLEILNRSLVPGGRLPRPEGSQVPSLSCFGILLARIQSILAGAELANHGIPFRARVAKAISPPVGVAETQVLHPPCQTGQRDERGRCDLSARAR